MPHLHPKHILPTDFPTPGDGINVLPIATAKELGVTLLYPNPINMEILLALPSNYIGIVTTAYHLQCCHPGPSHHFPGVQVQNPLSC